MVVLKMERPMDNWNDDRLDEMSRRMDEGFKEMREGFARMDARFEKVATREELNRLENRVDRLYYGCVALLVLLIGNSIVAPLVS
ncbi:MAG TPA: hypothetical protein VFS54_03250 [Solirubrobacterales bacterium]|nr:hypothetical protein [Solirubrobacterales bacterium]